MEWQPIETAPKDGTRVLAFYSADEIIYDVVWNDPDDGWSDVLGFVSTDGEIENFNQPDLTHWMPLPAPPKGK